MVFWKEKGVEYWATEINNTRLLEIAQKLTDDRFNFFDLTKEQIENIFEECFNRGLMDAHNSHEKCHQALENFEYFEQKRIVNGWHK